MTQLVRDLHDVVVHLHDEDVLRPAPSLDVGHGGLVLCGHSHLGVLVAHGVGQLLLIQLLIFCFNLKSETELCPIQ